jgi:hypothetical protein
MAADDSTSDSARAMEFMKEAAITTEIKTKLAAEHITSLERIHVDHRQGWHRMAVRHRQHAQSRT